MLPKFASHLLHHTSRAAATAQNYAFRNVLGLQNPSTTPGGLTNWSNNGSSSWGGHGTGAGGAKYNTGNRFYQGYSNAGRAVTQANSSTAHDANGTKVDDEEELRLKRPALIIKPRSRQRSSSLSLAGTGRRESAETLGVLRSVQLHQARAKHVLARVVAPDVSVEDEHTPQTQVDSPRRVITRRNSTASSAASELESLESLESAPQPVTPNDPSLVTDPSAPQTSFAPADSVSEDASDNAGEPVNVSVFEKFDAARKTHDPARILAEVMNFRTMHPSPNVREYNMALGLLLSSRTAGEPITIMLETYNEMLTRQITPNVRTYKTMLLALCERDKEVQRVISQLEIRMKRQDVSSSEAHQANILRKEDNFGSALLIFEAAQTIYRDGNKRNLCLGQGIYHALLRSCALHGNVNAAVRIWAHIESIDSFNPDAMCFFHLLSTYATTGDLESAQDVFNEFRLASKEGRVSWAIEEGAEDLSTHILSDDKRTGKARGAQMLMWMKMIEAYFMAKQPVKAISLLEEMMDSKASTLYGPMDVPPPCNAIYTAFIVGFIQNGDIHSALSWFDRMLKQDTLTRHDLEASPLTPRPNQAAWNAMLEALAEKNMVPELNRLFSTQLEIADRDALYISHYDRSSVFELNVEHIRRESTSTEEFDKTVSFLINKVLDLEYHPGAIPFCMAFRHHQPFVILVTLLAQRGRFDVASKLLEDFIQPGLRFADDVRNFDSVDSKLVVSKLRGLQSVLCNVIDKVLLQNNSDGNYRAPALNFVSRLGSLMTELELLPDVGACSAILQAFKAVSAEEKSKLSAEQWSFFSSVLSAYVDFEMSGDVTKVNNGTAITLDVKDVSNFFGDMGTAGLTPKALGEDVSRRLVAAMLLKHGKATAREIVSKAGAKWAAFLNNNQAIAGDIRSEADVEASELRPAKLDQFFSRSVDEYYPANPRVTPQMAWFRYESGAAKDTFPMPEVIGRLIATFGRVTDTEKVNRLYRDGQRVLKALEDNKERQSLGWYAIEDAMIIALSHCGQIDKAHVHRQRIIDLGGTPSADAYGALIQYIKETTDDSTNALALWEESQIRGVTPNLFLFNTIISKLSKARKADYALELFQQMKANFIRPSSVTYGAVIAACCRVGDAQSAEILFEEMTSQKNFRPRIPPYNTMIQFYTHIVRDRERALHYFGSLLSAGIQPSSHTYKLLLDCYGTIEPVDVSSMEDVFSRLVTDRRLQVTGVHWASLINSYGCVLKDLAKASDIFDSIEHHPTAAKSGAKMPDALCYEAMLNVLVTLRRTDLIPTYLDRLHNSGIHMTAYIANLLIKGYAAAGQLDEARQIFEGLSDPPIGVAAPNNHVPHDGLGASDVPPAAPVYREPSTWEAMVRAELGAGNRDNAVALLQRVQARQFPQAVYQRISGIMIDDPVASPWTTPEAMSPSS